MFSFVGQMVSVSRTQFCPCSLKASTDDTQANGCDKVPIKLNGWKTWISFPFVSWFAFQPLKNIPFHLLDHEETGGGQQKDRREARCGKQPARPWPNPKPTSWSERKPWSQTLMSSCCFLTDKLRLWISSLLQILSPNFSSRNTCYWPDSFPGTLKCQKRAWRG